MEILLAAVVAAIVAAAVVALTMRTRTERLAPVGPRIATRESEPSGDGVASGDSGEVELPARRAEIARIEERLLSKEESLDLRLAELARKERVARGPRAQPRSEAREAEGVEAGARARAGARGRPERGPGAADPPEARSRTTLRHDSARLVRQVEEEAKRDADRRARNILATVMQRMAAGHAVETTVSVVALQSDELKGRIIGREGRNIRALETLTGIDFIIDDTPGAVVLSGFDGVRREIARLTLEKLLQDGRIHPARIEEAYYQAKSEIDQHIVEVGEQAVFEANVRLAAPRAGEAPRPAQVPHELRPERAGPLDRVRPARGDAGRASSARARKTARRAALLHDIGKAVTHEVEGPHALVGGELARRYKEAEAVAHAMEAHHNEVEMQTVEAVIVQMVDSLSGARPGARGESLEQYVKRLQRPRGDRRAPRRRREGLRDAGRARDPRDRRARARSTTTRRRCSPTRSPATSRRSSSTPARSR